MSHRVLDSNERYAPPEDEPCDMESNDGTRVGGRLTQWATNDDSTYYPVGRTVNGLPPGAYEIGVERGQVFYRRFEIDITGLMHLPDTKAGQVVAEIKAFWERGHLYERYKITQRRGILIAGPSGCGKTSTSKMVCVDVIGRGGVIFAYNDAKLLIHGLGQFRRIQPDTPVVVLMEDIDEIIEHGSTSMILNVLDGVYSEFGKVVFVATTNFPDRLERRITNRPSRFDCVITVTQPNLQARLLYLRTIAGDIAPECFDVDMAALDSDGLSFAHLKELFTATVILGMSYDTALTKSRAMADGDMPSGDEMERAHTRGRIGMMGGKKIIDRYR